MRGGGRGREGVRAGDVWKVEKKEEGKARCMKTAPSQTHAHPMQ